MAFSILQDFFKEEVRCDYLVSSTMKEIWATQLEILNEIKSICEKHNIKYFAIGGTLLGALRHNGFIPWDDDLDIAMFRDDYNKFCAIAPSELSHPFFFQSEYSDPGYLLRHAKVRNSLTTGILMSQKDKKFTFNQGIFVDIFPLDRIPNDILERTSYYEELYQVWGKVYEYSSKANRENNYDENLDKELCKINAVQYNKKYEELCARYKDFDTNEIAILCLTISANKSVNNNFVWDVSLFDDICMKDFEFIKIPIPMQSDAILQKQYGNWKEFVKAPSCHGEVFFDTNHSYIHYL